MHFTIFLLINWEETLGNIAAKIAKLGRKKAGVSPEFLGKLHDLKKKIPLGRGPLLTSLCKLKSNNACQMETFF
jgi:hypothetical protein